MNDLIDLEAERIVSSLTIDELKTAAKVGVMFTLLFYGRLFGIVKRVIQEVQHEE